MFEPRFASPPLEQRRRAEEAGFVASVLHNWVDPAERFGDSGGGLMGPPNAGDGIAGGVVFQQDFDGLDYFGRFFSTGLRPAPGWRIRPTSTS